MQSPKNPAAVYKFGIVGTYNVNGKLPMEKFIEPQNLLIGVLYR